MALNPPGHALPNNLLLSSDDINKVTQVTGQTTSYCYGSDVGDGQSRSVWFQNSPMSNRPFLGRRKEIKQQVSHATLSFDFP